MQSRARKESNFVLWIIHSDSMQSGCEIPLHFLFIYQQPQRVWHDFRINIEQNY